jgi:hypothetical protein
MQGGPGDEILKELELGTADDLILKKYKINADQLHGFKSVRYGLKNNRLKQEEVGELFPELKDYFSPPAPVAPPGAPTPAMQQPAQNAAVPPAMQPPPPSQPAAPPEEVDLLDLAKKRKGIKATLAGQEEAGRQGKTGGITDPYKLKELEGYRKEIAGLEEKAKGAGYDEGLLEDFADIPEGGFSIKKSIPELVALREKNPLLYSRALASIKSKGNLFNAISKQAGEHKAHELIQGQQALEAGDNRKATRNAIELVRTYVHDTEEQNKLINEIKNDKYYVYGIQGMEKGYDDRFQGLNPYQVTYLHFLEDTSPAEFEALGGMLKDNPDDMWMGSNETSIRKGYEQKAKEAELKGMKIMRNAYEEKLTSYKNKVDRGRQLSPEEEADVQKITEDYKTLQADIKNQGERYPLAQLTEANRTIQDKYGSQYGQGASFLQGITSNLIDKPIDFVEKLVGANGAENSIDDLEKLGDEDYTEMVQWKTPEGESEEREYITKVSPELKKKLDAVWSDEKLSEDERRKEMELLVAKNQDDIGYERNPKAGQINLTGKSILNRFNSTASQLLPQMALAYMTGGTMNASKVQQLSSLFGSTLAMSTHDFYIEALRKNIANPGEYAFTHAVIEAASELPFNNLKQLREVFGSTSRVGKILGNISEDEFNAIAKSAKGRYSKIADAFMKAGVATNKAAIEEGAEEVIGNVGHNLNNKEVFAQQEGNILDGSLKSFVNTYIGMLPFGVPGGFAQVKNSNIQEKYALYEAVSNPSPYLEQLAKMEQSGQIEPAKAAKIKSIIKSGAAALAAVPSENLEGQKLTDNEKAEYLFNQVAKNDIKEQQKDLPAPIQEEMKAAAEKLDEANAEILKPKKKPREKKPKAEEAKTEETVRVPEEVAPVAEPVKEKKIAPKTETPFEKEKTKIKEDENKHVDDLIAQAPSEKRDGMLGVTRSHAESMIDRAEELIAQEKQMEDPDEKFIARYEKQAEHFKGIKDRIDAALQPEEKATEDKQAEEFKSHAYEQLKMETTADADRLEIPGMKPSEAKKAMADIEAGKDTAGAQRLQKALDDIYRSGSVPLIQGTGGHSNRMDVPLDQYMKRVNEPSDILKDVDISTPEQLDEEIARLFVDKSFIEEKPKQTAKPKQPARPQPGNKVEFEHAGNPMTGEIIETLEDGRYRIKDSKGNIYRVKPDKVNKGDALPKIGAGVVNRTRPANEDVKQYTPQSIIDQSREFYKGDPLISRVADFLEPIIKGNPNIRIDHNAKVDEGVLGYSYSDGRVELNFDELQDYDSLYRTALHEMVHAATRNEIKTNQAFKDDLGKVLDEVRQAMNLPDNGAVISAFVARGIIDADKYGAANEFELLAEVFTNQNFYEALKNLEYKGDNMLHRLFLAIAKFFSENYKQLAEAKKQISAENIADYLMQLTEAVVAGEQGADNAGALPAIRKVKTKEEAIKKLIQNATKQITDEQLLERLEKGTDVDPAILQQWIDEIRNPPTPPKPPFGTDALSPEERDLAIKMFDRLLSAKTPKKPSWWKTFWGNLSNASAWWDNPYRFVSKIAEDIRYEYKTPKKDAIPLGRAFEKNASGRAALKVQAFVNEVILGKIGGKKLGKIQGKEFADFQRYIAAKRVIDRLDTQERKRAAGEDVSRQTGNITKQFAQVIIEELEKVYDPEKMEEFEARAEAFQEHMDEMLKTLQAAGIISQETYDQIKEDNDFYAPFSVVQEKLLADQDAQPVGISGVIKRIKGIGHQLPKSIEEATDFMNDLAKAMETQQISPEEYFHTAVQTLKDLRDSGVITTEKYDNWISHLENPGFQIQDIIDAAANMIYKAEGMALKNIMMQRLYELKQYDTKGMFIQDVEGFMPMTVKGETRMVPKPLNQIPVEEGMAPIRLRVDGDVKTVAVNKRAAEKLNMMNNFETSTLMKGVDLINKIFRALVITLSPGFQAVNFAIDLIRTTMLSRYGLLAGRGLAQPLLNAILYVPQYIEALMHSSAGNVGVRTDTFKQWMESDSFSKGMFDNLFDNEKKVKEITATGAKRILHFFTKLKFIEVPGSILEQTHKIVVHQRGMAVEGLKPEMFTAMLSSLFDSHVNSSMTKDELKDAMDRLNYEVQNYAGSPNFPQTHKWLKITSIFLQFFSARVKGEATDYRRVANLFTGKGEGVKLSAQERTQMLMQFGGMGAVIAAYAIANNLEDDDEEQFNSIPTYHQENSLNIPAGEFEFEFEDGSRSTFRDYIKIPMRGITATMNVAANSFVKYYKRQSPDELKNVALTFLANSSPVNLHGDDTREKGESLVSNLTPVFKYFLEYSFNRNTHRHRDIINDQYGDGSMLAKYKAWQNSPNDNKEGLAPWDVATKNTPEWAKEWSKFLYDHLGIEVAALTLDHIEDTMGNPTELYHNAVKKRLQRSRMRYPVKGATGHVVEPEEEVIEE